MAELDTLITGEPSKLPPDIAALLDPAIPLPAGVTFYEKRFEIREMMKRLFIAGAMALAAIIIIPFGVYCIFHPGPVTVSTQADYLPLGFGLLLALCVWILLESVKTSYQLRNQQSAGLPTRRGVFLLPTSLVLNDISDTTVVPPSHFLGVEAGKLKYRHKSLEKSVRLPAALVGATQQQLHDAIEQWARAQTPPPL